MLREIDKHWFRTCRWGTDAFKYKEQQTVVLSLPPFSDKYLSLHINPAYFKSSFVLSLWLKEDFMSYLFISSFFLVTNKFVNRCLEHKYLCFLDFASH